MLNIAKIKYWFIELKLCDLMWIMRRVRYIIETFIMFIIIYIDHVVNTFIIKQTTLNSININKFNLRLIWIFIYFFQFRLNIKHKSNKNHVIFNALSRFFFDNNRINNQFNFENFLNFDIFHKNIIDSFVDSNIYVFQKFLIIMFDAFRKQILKNYVKKTWRNMIIMLKSLIKRITIEKTNLKTQKIVVVDDNEINKRIFKKLKIDIHFELILNDIIHYININIRRSCISKIVEKNISINSWRKLSFRNASMLRKKYSAFFTYFDYFVNFVVTSNIVLIVNWRKQNDIVFTKNWYQ